MGRILFCIAMFASCSCAQIPSGTLTPPIGKDFCYVDGTIQTSVESCIKKFGASPGTVWVPTTYTGTPSARTTIPDNVEVIDFTQNGRMTIYTNAAENSAGSSVGLSILAGRSNGLGTCWPGALPSANNLVASFVCDAATSGHPSWASNLVAVLPSNAADTTIWGLEVDTNIYGSNRRSQYVGIDSVSGGQVSPTHAIRAYTAPGAGVWAHAFRASGQMGSDIYEIDSPDSSLTLTQNVKPSDSVQTVTFSGKFGTANIGVGGKLSVDSGASQEDVILTGGANRNIAAVFTKHHSSGARIAPYSANRIFEANNAVTASVPYHIGSLRAWANSNTTQVLGFSINDTNGTERLSDFYSAANGQRIFRDVGTSGWSFQNRDGNPVATIGDDGTFGGKNIPIVGSFTTTAAASDVVALPGMTAAGHCVLQPTNSAAAAGVATVFVSAKGANQITVNHAERAGLTFDIMCTSN